MSNGNAVGAVRPMGGSANGGRSIGSGGAITSWDEFEAWASSVEALDAATVIDKGLAEAETARHPFAPEWAPLEVLVSLVAKLIELRIPSAALSLLAGASGRAGRFLAEGRDSIESRLRARAELERPLRTLLGMIRGAREAAEHAKVNDSTVVVVDDEHRSTWGDFLAANDEMDPDELTEIRAALESTGTYDGGGGAGAEWSVRLADDTDEDAHLAQWAHCCGLEITHSPGCPGMVVPGVALIIDETIAAPERHETIRSLLRRYGSAEAA